MTCPALSSVAQPKTTSGPSRPPRSARENAADAGEEQRQAGGRRRRRPWRAPGVAAARTGRRARPAGVRASPAPRPAAPGSGSGRLDQPEQVAGMARTLEAQPQADPEPAIVDGLRRRRRPAVMDAGERLGERRLECPLGSGASLVGSSPRPCLLPSPPSSALPGRGLRAAFLVAGRALDPDHGALVELRDGRAPA